DPGLKLFRFSGEIGARDGKGPGFLGVDRMEEGNQILDIPLFLGSKEGGEDVRAHGPQDTFFFLWGSSSELTLGKPRGTTCRVCAQPSRGPEPLSQLSTSSAS